MDINEQSFQTIADYLNQTLSPDPNVRRPGMTYCFFFATSIISS